MQPIILSPIACLKFGWNTFKVRQWFFIGVTLLLSVIDIAVRIFVKSGPDSGFLVILVVAIASWLLGALVTMGSLSFGIKAHDAPTTVTIRDLWPNLGRYWKYLVAQIFTMILFVVGLILLVVPGIFACIVFAFAYYLVIDRGLGPIAAMKESVRLTKGNRWRIAELGVLIFLINVAGLLALGIGLLVALPVSMFAFVHAYRTLAGNQSAPVTTAPTVATPVVQ